MQAFLPYLSVLGRFGELGLPAKRSRVPRTAARQPTQLADFQEQKGLAKPYHTLLNVALSGLRSDWFGPIVTKGRWNPDPPWPVLSIVDTATSFGSPL